MLGFKEYLLEMTPKLNDEEGLSFRPLSKISNHELNKFYILYKEISKQLFLYQKKKGNGFILVQPHTEENVYLLLSVTCRTEAFPKQPLDLYNPLQISFVQVSDGMETKGYARLTYKALIEKYDLISDSEQYQSSKALWQSLARTENVYVYDCRTKVYLKYDGKNIDENEIWNKKEDFRNILLVGKK